MSREKAETSEAPAAASAETPLDRLRKLSRLEYFAGCALTAVLVRRGIFEKERATVIEDAWAIADDMLASCDPVKGGR